LEGDRRVAIRVEEVVGAQVAVALLVSGVDARDSQRHLDGRLRRVVAVQHRGSLELVERAAHLGDHRVSSAEAEAAVRAINGVVAGKGPEVRRCRGHLSRSSWYFVELSTNTIDNKG